MSYASRLAAISTGHVPAAPPRPTSEDAEPARMEAESSVHRSSPAPTAVAAAPQPGPAVVAAPAAPASHVAAPSVTREAAEPVRRDPAVVTRETIERHAIVEAAPPPVPPRRTAVMSPPPVPPPSDALPAQAIWLAEDASAADPLVATADNDALRELMRSVRQWTSSAPTVIEPHHHESSAGTAPDPAVAPPQAQVSIGNVTITVEDAPAAPSQRAAREPRTASDRMARHHIRGGR
jgi:hypothetical protein